LLDSLLQENDNVLKILLFNNDFNLKIDNFTVFCIENVSG